MFQLQAHEIREAIDIYTNDRQSEELNKAQVKKVFRELSKSCEHGKQVDLIECCIPCFWDRFRILKAEVGK